jgi:hypothetical protein
MDCEFPELPNELKKLFENKELEDEIRLDKNGTWHHNDQPFKNQKLIDFFNKSINVTMDGTYVIHYDTYTYPITVEDAPLFVTGVVFRGFLQYEKITMNLTNGKTELLDVNTLYYKNKALYCRVENGKLIAKFKTSPSYHILDRIDEIDGKYYLKLSGQKILLQQE